MSEVTSESAAKKCPWRTQDGLPCESPRETGGGYCASHRREYQRNRRATGGAAGTRTPSLGTSTVCYGCNTVMTRGIRRETIRGKEWCGYCLRAVEYIANAAPETRRRCLELLDMLTVRSEHDRAVDEMSKYLSERTVKPSATNGR